MVRPHLFPLPSVNATKQLAHKLAKNVPQTPILALVGPLGAGKTTFVKAFASALGSATPATSPTFVWLKTYPLSSRRYKRLHHIDCYRLGAGRANRLDPELTSTLAMCQNDPRAITVIEWADKIKTLVAPQATWLYFQLLSPPLRRVMVKRP